jgi:hypothetical protein
MYSFIAMLSRTCSYLLLFILLQRSIQAVAQNDRAVAKQSITAGNAYLRGFRADQSLQSFDTAIVYAKKARDWKAAHYWAPARRDGTKAIFAEV